MSLLKKTFISLIVICLIIFGLNQINVEVDPEVQLALKDPYALNTEENKKNTSTF